MDIGSELDYASLDLDYDTLASKAGQLPAALYWVLQCAKWDDTSAHNWERILWLVVDGMDGIAEVLLRPGCPAIQFLPHQQQVGLDVAKKLLSEAFCEVGLLNGVPMGFKLVR